jgi:DNA-binding GntR family transcriptional regulator
MKSRVTDASADVSIRKAKNIERIRSLLVDRPRDLLFFELAVRTGLPASYLLNLKVADLEINGSEIYMNVDKKGSQLSRPLFIDALVADTIRSYLADIKAMRDDYLFPSRKAKGPLTISSASRMVRGWFRQLKLKQPVGLLSLRRAHHIRDQIQRAPDARARLDAKSRLIPRTIKYAPLKEKVFYELQSAILSGRVLPGEKILAEDIARQMGVSRTPVREALSRLEATGFIYPQKGGGSIVNDLSEKELEEIVEVRLLLEIAIAKHVTSIESDVEAEETYANLENLLDKMKSASERKLVDDYLNANQEFHHTIYRMAQRPVLFHLVETVWHRISPYLYIEIRRLTEFDWMGDIARHYRMLEALRIRDTEELCRLLTEDIQEVARAVKLFFNQSR